MHKKRLLDSTPKRIIARLDIKNGHVVKGVMMEGVQSVGNPVELCQRYYDQGVDELLLLDTVASLYKRIELPQIITEIVKNVFVPVCAGGGITCVSDAEKLFYSGADKICINTAAIRNPLLLKELSQEFGAQSIVLQMDARFLRNECRVFYNTGRDLCDLSALDWLEIAQDHGVGEILVTSIEKDGTARGLDQNLIALVSQNSRVPVIYGGGVSEVGHIDHAFTNLNISGIVLASFLHIDKYNIGELKRDLLGLGHPIREDL